MPQHITGSALALPEDRVRSPRTGWDRRHWEAQADQLLDGVLPFASPSFAGYALPGRASWSGPASDSLEGFARTFLLAAFRIAGTGGRGEPAARLLERYAAGLTAGTDAAHPEAWPRIDRDRTQPMVEAASVALALHETRRWLWDALPEATRLRTAEWLGGFVGRTPVGNNWMLFQTVVEEFLCSVGAPHQDAGIRRGLDALEQWQLGPGWYNDGPGQAGSGRRVDHYNGWALHLYPLLWTRLAAGGPRAALAEDLGRRYRERLRLFLADYVHLIGTDGAPLHQGRSLTYRFAAAAPLWMGELFDCSPGPAGLARRAASGMLRHFAEHGAPDPDGLLNRGWHGPFLELTQAYSGPASPYWAVKGFLGLLLPAGHPAWTATEQPLPLDLADTVRLLPGVNWLVQGTRADGIVRVHNHGSDGIDLRHPPEEQRGDPHYAKLVYTTRTAPVLRPEPAPACCDNELLLTAPGAGDAGAGEPGAGDAARTVRRGLITPLCLGPGRPPVALAASAHSVDAAAGTRVETLTVVEGRFELRVHAVLAPADWLVSAGGHCLAAATAPEPRRGAYWTAVAHPDGTLSALAPLHGFPTAPGTADVVRAREANAFGPEAAFPRLRAAHPATGARFYATCATLTGEPLDPDTPPPFTVRPEADGGLLLRGDATGWTLRLEPPAAGAPALLRWSATGSGGGAADPSSRN